MVGDLITSDEWRVTTVQDHDFATRIRQRGSEDLASRSWSRICPGLGGYLVGRWPVDRLGFNR